MVVSYPQQAADVLHMISGNKIWILLIISIAIMLLLVSLAHTQMFPIE